jgi:hypothetical protein
MLGLLSAASPERVLDEIRDIGDALRHEKERAESAESAIAATYTRAIEEFAEWLRLHLIDWVISFAPETETRTRGMIDASDLAARFLASRPAPGAGLATGEG